METERVDDRLNDMNAYQIAGLAVLASTVAALGVLYVLQKTGLMARRVDVSAAHFTQPAVPHVDEAGTPRHFSEELVIPGFTQSGEEIAEEDAANGHSPEGV